MSKPKSPTNETNDKELEKIKEALKSDFRKLYVKQFTTGWKEERMVREIEIDVMSLDNLEAALLQREIDSLKKLMSKYRTYHTALPGLFRSGNLHSIGFVKAVPIKTIEKELADLKQQLKDLESEK